MSRTQEIAAERLVNDIRAMERDADALLRASNGLKDPDTREQSESALRAAKERLSALASGAYERTKHAAEATNHYVRANPWQSVGIGAAAGMLVGFLIARR